MNDQPTRIHPLFPLRDGEERDDYPQIGWIHVTRYEAGGQVWAPRLFTNAELTDQSDITQMFGGGRYELVARDPEKTSIVRRESYNLAGPARPLSVDSGAGTTPPTPAPHHAPAPSGGDGGFMPLLLAMMQTNAQQAAAAATQQTQLFAAMMQAQGQQSAQMTQVLVAALSNGKQDPAAFIEAAAKLASANGGGGGGNAFAAFKDGMQTAFGIAEAAAPEEKSDLQDLTEGLQAAAQVMNAAKAGPGGAPS